ncbi:bifunctional 2-polyprenyl-6-hydroxyphenol methylase/3-demethylubiquinol 3-O-methyltransferase UbiG [uncultured Acetatifactor sp.]|jgi:SAM-dependent methyltransferase|uniref:class I SAM-dependent methyltransferase n=1 Tax=uncultured Acetatifactor sp. TaxID=1671927 RepID=UPI0026283606|nr:class I SAM-dependent methyltransferase [uncultured Acetatifactor sp.]
MAILHTDFSNQTINEDSISAADKKTYSYISQYGDIHYDPVISEETDWQLFFNLTELRKGVLSWYDFPPQARVLEIGAGFGTLTGCLCGKCAHVTATERSLYRARAIARRYEDVSNLDVYAGDLLDMEFPERFDYIVLVGILERMGKGSREPEPYIEYLQFLQGLLKPGGCLLAAVENRFGLRYFCGEEEPHTHRPFDGMNRYAWGASGHSFSRREMADIVQAAGFCDHKFYYLLPDYKLPQLIYTDACLPDKGIREKLIPYYRNPDTLIACERELYYDVIDNDVFPFFANSFLVECNTKEISKKYEAWQAPLCPIIYAAVSTDRGAERGFATVIRTDGVVHKKSLYEAGQHSARKLYENIADLHAHGIPVVEHRLLPGDILEMPFIPWPTLSDYMKGIMRDRQDELLEMLDRIYEYILQSSEQIPAEENALSSKLGADIAFDSSKKPDFGPILEKAYMELIPLNCFYNAKTDEFLYFDQEFVREHYPAKYVLFRAIHYMYCFTPNAEQYCPKEKLIVKYGMEDTWQIFFQEEQIFLEEVRNKGRYSQFYQRTGVDQGRIYANIMHLKAVGRQGK